MIITKKSRRGERMEARSNELTQAMALFPLLTAEERIIVREMIESLRQNQEPAFVLPETTAKAENT